MGVPQEKKGNFYFWFINLLNLFVEVMQIRPKLCCSVLVCLVEVCVGKLFAVVCPQTTGLLLIIKSRDVVKVL